MHVQGGTTESEGGCHVGNTPYYFGVKVTRRIDVSTYRRIVPTYRRFVPKISRTLRDTAAHPKLSAFANGLY